MIGLLRTGSALGKDRGVFGCANSRMEFRGSSENGLFSSQGTPDRTFRLTVLLECFDCHGWQRGIRFWSHLGLELRRMRHKTRNSSIRFFGRFFGLLFCVNAAWAVTPKTRDQQITEVAENFEGMVVNQVYSQMVRSNRLVNRGDDSPFAPSNAELIYRSWLEDEMMKQVTKARPFGVADLVARQLKGEIGIGHRALLEPKQKQK